MSQNGSAGAASAAGRSIDWTDEDAIAIDGFSVAAVIHMLAGGDVTARCAVCEATHAVEPDAQDYRCPSCGNHAALTSPLVKLGLI